MAFYDSQRGSISITGCVLTLLWSSAMDFCSGRAETSDCQCGYLCPGASPPRWPPIPDVGIPSPMQFCASMLFSFTCISSHSSTLPCTTCTTARHTSRTGASHTASCPFKTMSGGDVPQRGAVLFQSCPQRRTHSRHDAQLLRGGALRPPAE
ncbi:hypothetical protein BD309DRAFT_966339 [Dichomitus squalens]|nr:hypothetical protein BD309DRAFT_966339 [Dichomitus squalens]